MLGIWKLGSRVAQQPLPHVFSHNVNLHVFLFLATKIKIFEGECGHGLIDFLHSLIHAHHFLLFLRNVMNTKQLVDQTKTEVTRLQASNIRSSRQTLSCNLLTLRKPKPPLVFSGYSDSLCHRPSDIVRPL